MIVENTCFVVSNLGGELVCIFVDMFIFHTCVYAFCLVFQEIYRLIQLSCCLHLQLMDSSQVEFFVMDILLYWVVLVFEHFILYESFVTNCQRGSLLGYKCLEQLANREHRRTYKLQKEDFRICLLDRSKNRLD